MRDDLCKILTLKHLKYKSKEMVLSRVAATKTKAKTGKGKISWGSNDHY